jgi:hypothetical protein
MISSSDELQRASSRETGILLAVVRRHRAPATAVESERFRERVKQAPFSGRALNHLHLVDNLCWPAAIVASAADEVPRYRANPGTDDGARPHFPIRIHGVVKRSQAGPQADTETDAST